jgi:archaellum component FlaG (FlaF/FlaG flagellin family)
MFRFAGLALTITTMMVAQERQTQAKQEILWAAISVQPSVFVEGHTNALQLYFWVVNDGSSPINPKVESSHLLINGVEPKDWSFVIGNGLRSPQFYALPPGQLLEFTYLLDRYFMKPGIYTVGWFGERFKALDISIRVLPAHR